MLKLKLVIKLKDPQTGNLVNQENELHGDDALERAECVLKGMLDSWVRRDGMQLRHLTLTNLD